MTRLNIALKILSSIPEGTIVKDWDNYISLNDCHQITPSFLSVLASLDLFWKREEDTWIKLAIKLVTTDGYCHMVIA